MLFQWYMKRAAICQVLARKYLDKGEVNLAIFYRNAAKGYEERAYNLTLKEVGNGLRK